PYLDNMPRPFMDGGYYVRTQENRPIAGPMMVDGAFVLGGLGGSGMHTAPAAGEIVAAHVTNSTLPPYAKALRIERYADPAYQALLVQWGASGQI
ncbi:MAG: FAD-binding oxidoreductase, partial [Chloroflexi bacterium]|nr:FAD-binding oxidoreductase [Chloroflexota bacterium]